MDKILGRAFLLLADPAAQFVMAALVVAIVMSVRSRVARRGNGTQSAAAVPGTVRVASVLVVGAWLVGYVAQWVIAWPDVAWWRFGLILIVASAGVAVVAVHGGRRVQATDPEGIVLPRRTWHSFVAARWLGTAAAAGVALFVVTVWTGAASSPDDNGFYTLLAFGDGGVTSFYGWAYGVPVLVGLVALTASTVFALHRIAGRRFHRAAAVANETAQRRATSTAIVQVAAGAIVLTLTGAAQMIGFAGAVTAGGGVPGGPMLEWSPGFSAFAGLFIWGGAAAQFITVLLLLAIAAGWSTGARQTVSSSPTFAAG